MEWVLLVLCILGIGLVTMAAFEQASRADAEWDAIMERERAERSEQQAAYENWLAAQDYDVDDSEYYGA